MKKGLLIIVIILCITSIGHAIALPQATRCMLVDFYDFEKDGKIYLRNNISVSQRTKLKSLIAEAEQRVAGFWGEKTSDPIFIYCNTKEDYAAFGSPFSTPAVSILHLQPAIVISPEGLQIDIISHELSHAELFERIGLLNRNLQIPVWFDEGLAMQVDHRPYYSIDTLKEISNNFQNLPKVKSLKSYASFGSGNREQIMMNYRTSKYEVQKWYTPDRLENFIKKINDGSGFEEAFQD